MLDIKLKLCTALCTAGLVMNQCLRSTNKSARVDPDHWTHSIAQSIPMHSII